MGEDRGAPGWLGGVVTTVEEFDRFVAEAMSELLDRATNHTKRFLKATGQWENDVAHEKLALRWGYELVERFLMYGRTEVPCRPLFLLDSLIAKYYSQPDPLCYHKDLLSPLGRFLDGLTSRAVVSRDALVALFYHFYGFRQGHVVKLLGFGMTESQRVYKNFERWRRSGWQRAIEEIGLTEEELRELEEKKQRDPERVNAETERLIRLLQTHYRKTEPEHYPCLPRQKWDELFSQDCAYDYRVWHLAMCLECFVVVCDLRAIELNGAVQPGIDLQIRPRQKCGVVGVFLPEQEGRRKYGTRQPAQRISPTSA